MILSDLFYDKKTTNRLDETYLIGCLTSHANENKFKPLTV